MWKLLILACALFAIGCAQNTPLRIEPATCFCEPIWGRASDWDVISDDLARNIYRHNRMCQEL